MVNKSILFGGVLAVAVTLCIVLPVIMKIPEGDVSTSNLVRATVAQGQVVGKVSDAAGMFLGIPFTQPPLGPLRWKRPQEPMRYSGKYWNATYLRPGCDQICDQPAIDYTCPKEESEDCLYLNVWVPKKYLVREDGNDFIDGRHYAINDEIVSGSTPKLAVMVWFYGGNFRNGAGSCTVYDGRFMSNKGDVIVVTTNYRVAQLGFLAFGDSGDEESMGNFGLYDQLKTLEWVQNNIHQFGGDKNKVTIFGQSAGAESSAVHLTSSISDKYFHKAILESNPFGLPFRTLDDARELGNRFASNLSCSDIDCLRQKSTKELEAAYNATVLEITDPSLLMLLFQPWGPVIDQELLFDQPINLFRQGKQQQKPIMMGSMADEGMIFLAEAFPNKMTTAVYNALVAAVFKREDAIQVMRRYPPCDSDADPECDNRLVLMPAVTDYVFFCPQRLALYNGTTTEQWLYYFNQTWSFKELWEIPECYDRVCHAAEVAYLFGVESLTSFVYTSEERELSNRLIKYWTNFAKYSNPNGNSNEDNQGLMEWPRFQQNYQTDDYTALQLKGSEDSLMQNPFTDSCLFWDGLDAYTKH